jgi:hypothetical protein
VELYSLPVPENNESMSPLCITPFQTLFYPIHGLSPNEAPVLPRKVFLIEAPWAEGSIGQLPADRNIRIALQHKREIEHWDLVRDPASMYTFCPSSMGEVPWCGANHLVGLRPGMSGYQYVCLGGLLEYTVESPLLAFRFDPSETGGGSWKQRNLWQPPPRKLPDMPQFTCFDEATGVVVIGMASGTIWLLDFARSFVNGLCSRPAPESSSPLN